MKRVVALFLVCLSMFTFVGCKEDEPELTDYQKVVQYIEENNGCIEIQDSYYGTIYITNPGNIIRIKNIANYSNTICVEISLDLKENEKYFNYEGTYIYMGSTDFTVEGEIKADTHDFYYGELTYKSKTAGTGTVLSTSLRVINSTMGNILSKAVTKISAEIGINIYELFGFDKYVH